MIALAATTPTDFKGVIELFTDIGLAIIPFIGTVAFLIFILGVARFIKSTGSDKEIKDSKNLLIWGVIGMFILVTIWGIITFLRSELGFNDKLGIPQVKLEVKS